MEKGVRISYEPTDIFLEADRERISQVVSNLLSNALKFTGKGSISISSTVSSDGNENDVYNANDNDNNKMAIINVKDDGQGIAPELLPSLFSKFVSKSFEGTGLGLYISKSIVEAH